MVWFVSQSGLCSSAYVKKESWNMLQQAMTDTPTQHTTHLHTAHQNTVRCRLVHTLDSKEASWVNFVSTAGPVRQRQPRLSHTARSNSIYVRPVTGTPLLGMQNWHAYFESAYHALIVTPDFRCFIPFLYENKGIPLCMALKHRGGSKK
jgi:hypothetical protein